MLKLQKFHTILFLFFLSISSLVAKGNNDNSYVLGNGVQVASLPLYLGGYISLQYKNKERQKSYSLDDVAFLAYGSYNKFSYMTEVEFQNLYLKSYVNKTSQVQHDTSLHVERLYGDYTFNENYMLRFGKYNSPIGFWNLTPINILRDTTSNPYSTLILFPKFTTGLLGKYLNYQYNIWQIDVMGQYNSDLDDDTYNNYNTDEHFGVGVTYIKNDLNLKFNVGTFRNLLPNAIPQHRYYALVSLLYEKEKYKIIGEFGSQRSKKSFVTQYAGYLQGSYSFAEQHSAIVRFESYKSIELSKKDNIAIIAYTYRPLYPIAFKAEYQIHSVHHENQALFSFSMMF